MFFQWRPVSAQHRQQHRRTLDGRLCAAAFVFDRQTHTGCSDSSNPAGEHGREWCYVDAQVAHASGAIRCALFEVCALHGCHACSYWMVVVGGLRGAIAVSHTMRRGERRRAQRARLFAAPGDGFALLRDAPSVSCAQRRACARILRQPALNSWRALQRSITKHCGCKPAACLTRRLKR